MYVAAAAAGLQWATVDGAASPIWPAAGIGVAGLLVGGRRLWPAIAIGQLVASLVTGAGHPLWVLASVGIFNALAAVAAVTMIRRLAEPRFGQLGTVREVLLLLAGALLAAGLASLAGAATLTIAGTLGPTDLPQFLTTWFFGDLVGIMVVTPLITTIRSDLPEQLTPARLLHLGGVLLACLVLAWSIFFASHASRAWLIYPALVWAAVAFRVRGVSLALLVLAAVASSGTLLGHGPFAAGPMGSPELVLLQQYLAITATTALLLGAAVDERHSESRLREVADRELSARRLAAATEDRLQLAMQSSAIGMWSWEIAENRVEWSDECYRIHGLDPGGFGGTSEAFDALVDPADKASVWASVEQTLASGTDLRIEFRIVRPDGERRWVANSGRAMFDESGKPLRIIGTINDITDARMAEDERARLVWRAEVAQRAARSSLYEYDVGRNLAIRDPYIRDLAGFSEAELANTREGWEAVMVAEDRLQFLATVEQALASAERFAMEYRIRTKAGEIMWISDTGQILRGADGQAERIVGLITDVTERKRAEDVLRLRTAELETLLESAPIGLAYFDREHRWTRINELLAEINGFPVSAHIGRSLEELLPVNAATVGPIIDQVFATGEAVGNREIKGETPSKPGLERHWLAGFYPVHGSEGVIAVGAWVIEISDRKAAEEREQLLAREVDHRAKNLLTVVQSVVQMTRADDPDEFRAGVSGRIQSLARAHSLLAASRWQGVELTQLARDELAAFATEDDDRVQIEGPPLRLTPTAGQSLALVLHELATNAAKYGSLSRTAGRLFLSWSRDCSQADFVRIEWREQGGSAAHAPERSGFGSRLIKASVERQLGGELAYHWGADGLTVQLLLPAAHFFASTDEVAAEREATPEVQAPPEQPPGCRVLLVEDEALIGLELEQALQEAGCTVVGVAASIAEALELIEQEQPEGVLLDINLAGDTSFPVADRLARDGIHFAFCSGYAADAIIPERFAGVPLIRKPFSASAVVDLFTRTDASE